MDCCADCGVAGGVSLKTCKSCMLVKYCNAYCQKNHWATHKTACKLRAAELHDEALFKDPPQKEECPICFLPMPHALLAVISLPLATISSIPIYDYSEAKKELASMGTEIYYSCFVGRVYVKDAFTPSVRQETMISAPFAKQRE